MVEEFVRAIAGLETQEFWIFLGSVSLGGIATLRAGYRAPLTVIGWEAGLRRFTSAPRENALLDNLDGITQPTLLITGDADTIVPTADTERLAGELSSAELVVVPRSGHLPHEERSDQFVAALVDWLRHPGKPLSLRATNGFLERTTRSSLRFPPRFLELIRQHQRRVSADARG
jgi:pimeloyl-ACP methyl ester carboxylesterase